MFRNDCNRVIKRYFVEFDDGHTEAVPSKKLDDALSFKLQAFEFRIEACI